MFQVLRFLEKDNIEDAKELLREMISSIRSKSIQTDLHYFDAEIQTGVSSKENATCTDFLGISVATSCSNDTAMRGTQKGPKLTDFECGNHFEFSSQYTQVIIDIVDKNETTTLNQTEELIQTEVVSTASVSLETSIKSEEVGCMAIDDSISTLAANMNELNQTKIFVKKSDSSIAIVQPFERIDKFSWLLKAKVLSLFLKGLEKNVIKQTDLNAKDQALFVHIKENTDIIGKLEIDNNSIRNELDNRISKLPKKIAFIKSQRLPLN